MGTPHEKLLAEKVIGPKMSNPGVITAAKLEIIKVVRTLKRGYGLSDEEISSLLAIVRKELIELKLDKAFKKRSRQMSDD